MAKQFLKFKINNIDGSPDLLEFHEEQLNTLIDAYKWSAAQALFYLKSKLSAATLEFYNKSTACKNATSVSQWFEIL